MPRSTVHTGCTCLYMIYTCSICSICRISPEPTCAGWRSRARARTPPSLLTPPFTLAHQSRHTRCRATARSCLTGCSTASRTCRTTAGQRSSPCSCRCAAAPPPPALLLLRWPPLPLPLVALARSLRVLLLLSATVLPLFQHCTLHGQSGGRHPSHAHPMRAGLLVRPFAGNRGGAGELLARPSRAVVSMSLRAAARP
eukprot:COSAG01_NODE_4329_length_5128_cov_153.260887_2_plen_198_part_00